MTVTDKQKANLKPFVTGDKRINRKGTPRTATVMREFIQQVGAETIKLPAANGQPSEEVTRIYALIRSMFSSKAPADKAAILKAIAPGLLRDELDVTSGGKALGIDYKIFNIDELTRIKNGESEVAVYADALQRLAASNGNG